MRMYTEVRVPVGISCSFLYVLHKSLTYTPQNYDLQLHGFSLSCQLFSGSYIVTMMDSFGCTKELLFCLFSGCKDP